MYRFLSGALALIAGCAPPIYLQPALSAPHSTVKVRMSYHSAPTRTPTESIRIGEYQLPPPAVRQRGSSHNATLHYRVRPEPASWTVGSVFSHPEQRTRTETYQERYSCGTTRVGSGANARSQTQYCNRTQTRQVTSTVTVVDAACETGFQLSPRAGATYILQYDFFAHDRCTATVFEEVVNADGVALVPVHPTSSAAAVPTATPAPTTTSLPTASNDAATLCEIAPGKWEGPLRVRGVTLTQSGYAQELVLTESSLRAHLSGDGWHVHGEADLRQDSILRAHQTMWVGEGVAVPAGGRVMVLAGEPGRVELGVAPTPGMTFRAAPRRWVPCAAVGLGSEEPSEDVVLDSLELPHGRVGHVLSLTLSHLPSSEPFVRQEANSLVHPVRILEERGESLRVAGYVQGGGSRTLMVGWTQARVTGVVVGMNDRLRRDSPGGRRCRLSANLSLFAAGEGLPKQEVGSIDQGTTVWARPSDGGWWGVDPVLGDEALQFADGIELSVRPIVPMECGLTEEP